MIQINRFRDFFFCVRTQAHIYLCSVPVFVKQRPMHQIKGCIIIAAHRRSSYPRSGKVWSKIAWWVGQLMGGSVVVLLKWVQTTKPGSLMFEVLRDKQRNLGLLCSRFCAKTRSDPARSRDPQSRVGVENRWIEHFFERTVKKNRGKNKVWHPSDANMCVTWNGVVKWLDPYRLQRAYCIRIDQIR